MTRLGHERIEAEKFRRRKQANNCLSLITIVGDSDNTRDEQINERGPLVLIENNFVFFETLYGQIVSESL